MIKKDFETKFIGWSFIFAAIMLWGGWMFSTHNVGEYLQADDFTPIGEHVWYWIWMYRIHIFGWVTLGIAMFGLVSVLNKKPYRVVVIPGIGMIVVGTFTLAIAAAFYYNFGAWGVGKTMNKSPEEIQTFMDSILPTNNYVTCFNRFGRIFSGVGLILFNYALVKWSIINKWIAYLGLFMGLAAVVLILSIADNFELYKPLFHIKVLWMVLMGGWLLLKGMNVSSEEK